jgi:hypothetical protein
MRRKAVHVALAPQLLLRWVRLIPLLLLLIQMLLLLLLLLLIPLLLLLLLCVAVIINALNTAKPRLKSWLHAA